MMSTQATGSAVVALALGRMMYTVYGGKWGMLSGWCGGKVREKLTDRFVRGDALRCMSSSKSLSTARCSL